MLSPSPLSLFCALLLCLPLAIVFTITTPLIPHPTTSSGGSTVSSAHTVTFTRKNKSKTKPGPALSPYFETHQKPKNSTKTTTTTPSVGPPYFETHQKPKNSTKTTTPTPAVGPPYFETHRKPKNSTKTTATTTPPSPPTTVAPRLQEFDDDSEDDSLYQLAGGVNSNKRPRKKKLAFMFLTTSPLPFAPLWEAFFNHTPKNLYNIYIHADPSFNYTPPFRGVFTHRVIPSKPTRRNSPTLTSAARRLLAHALLHDKSNYMFALLSPACIPLRSFNFTYGVLTQSKKSFIEILDNEPGAFDRWAARGEDAMLPEVKFEDFRIGSQFVSLTRKHAVIVVRDRRLWSKFKLPCLQLDTCYPEEHYFPTLLNMVDPHGCVPATLTHVDWRGSYGGHPRTYKPDQVNPELILTLKNSRPRYGDDPMNGSDSSVSKRHDPFLFARKFSPKCIQPLMSIANDVIFKD